MLSESNESVKPFRCPGCREYLVTGVKQCRFCGVVIDPAVANEAARWELIANRSYRKRNYSKHFFRGSGLFALGVVIMVCSYFLFWQTLDTDFIWIPRALVLGGGGDALYGVYGLVSEAINARSEIQ